MRVLTTLVDLQLSELLMPKNSLGQHSTNSQLDSLLWLILKHIGSGNLFEVTDEAGVVSVHLGRALVSGEANLVCVDDHHEVATVDVWRIGWLALTAEEICCFSS